MERWQGHFKSLNYFSESESTLNDQNYNFGNKIFNELCFTIAEKEIKKEVANGKYKMSKLQEQRAYQMK